jgi:hypothetical protein
VQYHRRKLHREWGKRKKERKKMMHLMRGGEGISTTITTTHEQESYYKSPAGSARITMVLFIPLQLRLNSKFGE